MSILPQPDMPENIKNCSFLASLFPKHLKNTIGSCSNLKVEIIHPKFNNYKQTTCLTHNTKLGKQLCEVGKSAMPPGINPINHQFSRLNKGFQISKWVVKEEPLPIRRMRTINRTWQKKATHTPQQSIYTVQILLSRREER